MKKVNIFIASALTLIATTPAAHADLAEGIVKPGEVVELVTSPDSLDETCKFAEANGFNCSMVLVTLTKVNTSLPAGAYGSIRQPAGSSVMPSTGLGLVGETGLDDLDGLAGQMIGD